MGSAAQFSGPAVTPDLAYAEIMMFIRSLNRAPRAVKLVTVGAITVTAQVHDSRKRRDQPAKECGLLIGHTGDVLVVTDQSLPLRRPPGPATTGQAAGQTARRQTRPNPPLPRPAPGWAYYGPPRRIRVENGLALFPVLRVPGAAINQAQREAALIRSTFRKSIANKPV